MAKDHRTDPWVFVYPTRTSMVIPGGFALKSAVAQTGMKSTPKLTPNSLKKRPLPDCCAIGFTLRGRTFAIQSDTAFFAKQYALPVAHDI